MQAAPARGRTVPHAACGRRCGIRQRVAFSPRRALACGDLTTSDRRWPPGRMLATAMQLPLARALRRIPEDGLWPARRSACIYSSARTTGDSLGRTEITRRESLGPPLGRIRLTVTRCSRARHYWYTRCVARRGLFRLAAPDCRRHPAPGRRRSCTRTVGDARLKGGNSARRWQLPAMETVSRPGPFPCTRATIAVLQLLVSLLALRLDRSHTRTTRRASGRRPWMPDRPNSRCPEDA